MIMKSLPPKGAILSREYPTPCSFVSCLSPGRFNLHQEWGTSFIIKEKSCVLCFPRLCCCLALQKHWSWLMRPTWSSTRQWFANFRLKKPCQGWKGDRAQWRTSKTWEPGNEWNFDNSSTKIRIECWDISTNLCDPGKPVHKLEKIKQDIPDQWPWSKRWGWKWWKW